MNINKPIDCLKEKKKEKNTAVIFVVMGDFAASY